MSFFVDSSMTWTISLPPVELKAVPAFAIKLRGCIQAHNYEGSQLPARRVRRDAGVK